MEEILNRELIPRNMKGSARLIIQKAKEKERGSQSDHILSTT